MPIIEELELTVDRRCWPLCLRWCPYRPKMPVDEHRRKDDGERLKWRRDSLAVVGGAGELVNLTESTIRANWTFPRNSRKPATGTGKSRISCGTVRSLDRGYDAGERRWPHYEWVKDETRRKSDGCVFNRVGRFWNKSDWCKFGG